MSLKDDLVLEKYKYVLSQKQALNEATFKIITVYQALVLALFAGQFAVVMATKDKLPVESGLYASWVLLALFVMISLLVLALLVGGVFSWLSYRQDESELASKYKVAVAAKKPVAWADVLRWYETYLVLFVVGFGGLTVYGFVKYIPAIFAI
ncbi:hypothetical protein [Pseudomonas sp. NPDC088890]|uniref:hypothetical protein n=1 Tax=Pseudomonas sp. NPDC088890 TaxID=3364458 RepID=UPI00384A767B